jgi:protein-disulfide isomerase
MVSAKRRKAVRRVHEEKPATNWPILIGIAAIGVILLFALLALSLREPQVATLEKYCQDNPDRCVAKGPADAPVTIVEVSDYACPACQDFNLNTAALLDQTYVESGQVRWIVLPYARSVVKAQSGPAAEAALCANEQDRFFEFHQLLFERQSDPTTLTRDGYLLAAEQLELDINDFNTCIDSNRYARTIDANIEAANLADVRATPTFFINGVKLEGSQPFTAFQQRIESLLERAGIEVNS